MGWGGGEGCGDGAPKGWQSHGLRALRGRGGGWRERLFSRRGAGTAPANTGRAQTRARHDRGRVGQRPVAEWWAVSVGVLPTLRACGARPSKGVTPDRIA